MDADFSGAANALWKLLFSVDVGALEQGVESARKGVENYAEKVGGDLSNRVGNISDIWSGKETFGDVFPAGEKVLRSAGQVGGGVTDFFGDTIRTFIPQGIQDKAASMKNDVSGNIMKNPESRKFIEGVQRFAGENPNLTKDIEALGNILMAGAVMKGMTTEMGPSSSLSAVEKANNNFLKKSLGKGISKL